MCEVRIIDYKKDVLSKEDVDKRIEELRNLIVEDDGLRKMRTDDPFLLRFLHRFRFNVNRAFKAVQDYYKFVVEEIDWIAVDITEDIKTFLDMKMRVMLPAVDKCGKKIFYLRTDTVNPTKVTLEKLNQLEYVWLESVLDDPKVQHYGLCLLIDASGISWRLMTWMTPNNIYRGIRKMQNIVVKDATIHVVRTSYFMKAIVKISWPMLPNILKQRIKFHYNDFESLHEYISPDNLPKEYGGDIDVDYEALNNELLSRDEEIRKKLEHYKLIASEQIY